MAYSFIEDFNCYVLSGVIPHQEDKKLFGATCLVGYVLLAGKSRITKPTTRQQQDIGIENDELN